MKQIKINKWARRVVGYSFYISAMYLIVDNTSIEVGVGVVLWTIGTVFMGISKNDT